jgi:hypothetical protein
MMVRDSNSDKKVSKNSPETAKMRGRGSIREGQPY